VPAKNPRVNISVDPGLFGALQGLAAEGGVSLSMVARDLIREALELREDVGLSALAEEREGTFDPKKALTHEQAWE
jgi:hypothetical protein